MSKTILVTGGAGYIGSHTVLCLLQNDYDVVVVDNLSNGSDIALERVSELAGKDVEFVNGDIRNEETLSHIFTTHPITGVIHFAGLKAVGESTQKPLEYYDNNVCGTATLLRCMQKAEVKEIVFSSSATVYGQEAPVPYVESTPRGTSASPYGATKAMIEEILEDVSNSDHQWKISSLRYFNPIGAHESGLIGEDPKGIPNNLMPYISQVAIGKREKLQVFGGDYPTPDGTCRRDYIHVMDLAEGHVAALQYIKTGFDVTNLGTGNPTSVIELIDMFTNKNGIDIPYEITDRRAGDLSEFWADAKKARIALNWKATRSLEDMVIDTWNWQTKNPSGYCDPLTLGQ